jgi:hypothetical protein
MAAIDEDKVVEEIEAAQRELEETLAAVEAARIRSKKAREKLSRLAVSFVHSHHANESSCGAQTRKANTFLFVLERAFRTCTFLSVIERTRFCFKAYTLFF